MKKIMSKYAGFLAFSLMITGIYSCIPAKKFEDLQRKEQTCQDENKKLRTDNQQLVTENTEMKVSGAGMPIIG